MNESSLRIRNQYKLFMEGKYCRMEPAETLTMEELKNRIKQLEPGEILPVWIIGNEESIDG